MAKIDHAGLLTESYEDAQRFFEEVFGMRKWREDGEKTGPQMLVYGRNPVK